jgi:hypothetical protein
VPKSETKFTEFGMTTFDSVLIANLDILGVSPHHS